VKRGSSKKKETDDRRGDRTGRKIAEVDQEWEAAGHETMEDQNQKKPEGKGEEDKREEWRLWE
jgi:hypothetical protein